MRRRWDSLSAPTRRGKSRSRSPTPNQCPTRVGGRGHPSHLVGTLHLDELDAYQPQSWCDQSFLKISYGETGIDRSSICLDLISPMSNSDAITRHKRKS